MPGWQTKQENSGNNTSDWQKMLAMYSLAGNNDANTMFGFALGKLLNQAWMDHLDRRHTKQLQEYINRNKTADALKGTTTGTPLGQVANVNPWQQSYAQNYNDQQFSNALAQGVASGKVSPEFAEGLATGGWNVGNAVPDYLKGTTQQATGQNNGTISAGTNPGTMAAGTGTLNRGLLGAIAQNTPMGKALVSAGVNPISIMAGVPNDTNNLNFLTR